MQHLRKSRNDRVGRVYNSSLWFSFRADNFAAVVALRFILHLRKELRTRILRLPAVFGLVSAGAQPLHVCVSLSAGAVR